MFQHYVLYRDKWETKKILKGRIAKLKELGDSMREMNNGLGTGGNVSGQSHKEHM